MKYIKTTLLGLAFSLAIVSCKKDDPTVGIQPCFVPEKSAVRVFEDVRFSNCTAGAVGFAWDFGDGNGSTESDPTHRYETDGEFTVSLTTVDSQNTRSQPESALISVSYTPEQRATGSWFVGETCGRIEDSYLTYIGQYPGSGLFQDGFPGRLSYYSYQLSAAVNESGSYRVFPHASMVDQGGKAWDFLGAAGQFSSDWDTLRFNYSLKAVNGNPPDPIECIGTAVRQ